MANRDGIINLDDAMDAPTPLKEAMDAPTPMDEPNSIDGEEVNIEEMTEDTEEYCMFELNSTYFHSDELLRKGENGHADIYLGRTYDTPKEKTILKLYQLDRKPKDEDTLYYLERAFLNEVRGFHLVPIYDYGWYEDEKTGQKRYYELLEYMEGGSLNGLPSNIDYNTLKTIVESAAYALYYLHMVFGLKHGDVKMSNLFLSSKEDGVVYLGDYDTLEFVGSKYAFDDDYDIDWVQLEEMTKRFKVAETEEFQSFLDDLEVNPPSLPYDEILHFARIEAERMRRTNGFAFRCSALTDLLKDGGYEKERKWVSDCYDYTWYKKDDGSYTDPEPPKGNGGCAPYSNFTSAWKAVYGLLGEDNPPKYFIYSCPQDLKKADQEWVLEELHNGRLKDWLAIFFHENPWKDFSKKFEYEREVERYLDYIRTLDPDDVNVKRLDEARATISAEAKGLGNWKLGIIFTQAVCGLLFAIPALLFIGWMIFHGLPIDGNPLTNSVGVGFLVIGCLVGGLLYTIAGRDDYEFSGCGCLIAGVVGAFLFALIFYLMVRYISFVLPALSWITILLMLGVGVFVFMTLFNKDLNYSVLSLHNDPDAWIVQPLYYAFDTSLQGYNYRQKSDFDDLREQYRDGLKKMVLKMVVPILFAWGMWLGYRAITPELGGKKVETLEDQINKMEGDWSGTFGENQATMQILNTSRDSFQLSMTVMFKKPVTQTFTGKVEGLTELKLDNDTPDDGILDGSLEADYDPDKPNVVSGKYKNYTTEKIYHFHFKKQITKNDSVQ